MGHSQNGGPMSQEPPHSRVSKLLMPHPSMFTWCKDYEENLKLKDGRREQTSQKNFKI